VTTRMLKRRAQIAPDSRWAVKGAAAGQVMFFSWSVIFSDPESRCLMSVAKLNLPLTVKENDTTLKLFSLYIEQRFAKVLS
jgi:hypothetical protein